MKMNILTIYLFLEVLFQTDQNVLVWYVTNVINFKKYLRSTNVIVVILEWMILLLSTFDMLFILYSIYELSLLRH